MLELLISINQGFAIEFYSLFSKSFPGIREFRVILKYCTPSAGTNPSWDNTELVYDSYDLVPTEIRNYSP